MGGFDKSIVHLGDVDLNSGLLLLLLPESEVDKLVYFGIKAPIMVSRQLRTALITHIQNLRHIQTKYVLGIQY